MSQSLFRGIVGLVLLLSLGCSAMQHVIIRDNTGFKVLNKGRWNRVKSSDVDPALREMDAGQLRKYFAAGCKIRASRCTNGDYVLRGHVPGKGGGPILAGIVYWGVKAIGYGALTGAAVTVAAQAATAVAVTTAATATATAVASTTAALMPSVAAAATAVTASIAAPAAAGTALGIATGAAVGASGAAASATATTALVAAATGGIGYVAGAIECAAGGLGALAALVPGI